MLIFTRDKKRLLEHFRKDPVLFAYHLGDLDDFHFEQCQWGATYGKSPRIDDVTLLYTGLATPTLLAFGLTEKFEELLREQIPILPPAFHCHFQEPYRQVFREHFRETDLGSHQKMQLVDFRPYAGKGSPEAIVRLDMKHEAELKALFEAAYPSNYFVPRMLESGKYLGYAAEGRIVAVTGIHTYSDEYKVAVLGNITTHPDYRGRGLAGLLTSRLLEELTSEGKMVCLNVQQDNAAAIRCYEKLGFVKVHEYEEALYE
ncbi:MAG: GNAT family N-acetyltransferase, partial [bacterium]|nr:GNAT family N-acetyltransferase [bacterium]